MKNIKFILDVSNKFMEEYPGKIVSIISGKGGVGKTTLSINVSVALSKILGYKVLLIDANITTSHANLFLGIPDYKTELTLNSLLKRSYRVEKLFQHTFIDENFFFLPSSTFYSQKSDIKNLNKVTSKLKKYFDFIILDAAPGLGREAVSAIMASDEILFVTIPYVPAIIDLLRVKEVLEEIPKNVLGIVLNMVEKKSYELDVREIEKITSFPVISIVPFDKNVLKSLCLNTPVVLEYPNSKASKSFIKIAKYIADKEFLIEEESFMDKIKRIFRLPRILRR